MGKIRICALIAVICFILPLFIYSKTSFAVEQSQFLKKLPLNTFISETIHNNPTVRKYIKQYAEASGEEYAARGIDDVLLTSLFSLAYKEGDRVSVLEPNDEKQIVYSVGASKIVSQSGTRINARYGNAWTDSSYPPIIVGGTTIDIQPRSPLYTPSVTLSLAQPLLKNILGIQDRLNLNVKRLQLETANLTYQENIEKFISEMANLYINWRSAFNNANTLERVYKKIAEQERLVRDEVKARVAEESDLFRVMEQKELYRAQWKGFLANYEALTEQVAAMMSPDNPNTNIEPTGLEGSFISTVKNEAVGMNYLKSDSRLRGILDLSVNVQEEVLAANKNAKLPDMNLFVNYRAHGADGSFTGAHGSEFDKNDILGGVNFSFPITNRSARGTYKAQEAKKRRTVLENSRIMLDATSNLAGLYESKRLLEQQVKAFEQQYEYGRKKLKEERDQYDDGRLSLFQLLQDQTSHIVNSVQLENAYANLAKTKLTIGELTDANLVAFSAAIEDVVKEEDKEEF